MHIMLGYLGERPSEIPAGGPIVIQCQTGGRSAIGASLLQAKGITDVVNLIGGIHDWGLAGLPVTQG